jgi:hypothetical protein
MGEAREIGIDDRSFNHVAIHSILSPLPPRTMGRSP